MQNANVMIHPTADVSAEASLGEGTRIWHRAHVREGAKLGRNCVVGKDAYIDFDVTIGDNVKIQNSALIYHGVTLEDGVFIGPQACLTNDLRPRAITPEGDLKGAEDWTVGPIHIRYGASIGAGALILPDVTVGRFAMVAAGAVVTRDVADHALVVGIPARRRGYVCRCGTPLEVRDGRYRCPEDGWEFQPEEHDS